MTSDRFIKILQKHGDSFQIPEKKFDAAMTDYNAQLEQLKEDLFLWIERRVAYERLMALIKPRLLGFGKPLIIGTSGDLDELGEMQRMFGKMPEYVAGCDPYKKDAPVTMIVKWPMTFPPNAGWLSGY